MEIIRNAEGVPTSIKMLKPIDGHQHVRQGDLLKTIAPFLKERFKHALIMPNTLPPITSFKLAEEYLAEIQAAMGHSFTPHMTLYLTDTLTREEIDEDKYDNRRLIVGVKYYPRGLTTNSETGVADPAALWTPGSNPYQVLQALSESGRVLLLHAADGVDKNGRELDPYDQESHFIRETLPRIIDAHPNLKISLEHLSTKEGAEFMERVVPTRWGLLGCSLTVHHLLLDRRNVFRGGLRPDLFCWPVIQPEEHREALRELVKKKIPFVWLGSDSAPHPKNKKYAACCMGGIFTAHAGIELYVEAFEDMGALDEWFEGFASINFARFFQVWQRGAQMIQLVREPWTVRNWFYAGADEEPVRPFRLGETIRWKLLP